METAPQDSARMIWFGVGPKAVAKRPAAGLLIIARSTGRVLLAKRADRMNDGGLWSTPGGVQGPEDEGSLIVTAVREVEEELAVSVTDEDGFRVIGAHENWNLRRCYTVFVVEVDEEFPTIVDGDETVDADWFSRDEALALDVHHQLRPLLETELD